MKNSIDAIGNRSFHLPAYSAVLQPIDYQLASTPEVSKLLYHESRRIYMFISFFFPAFLSSSKIFLFIHFRCRWLLVHLITHTHTHTHTHDWNPLVEESSRRRIHTILTRDKFPYPEGIRTHNLRRRAAADLRLTARPLGPGLDFDHLTNSHEIMYDSFLI